MFIKTEERKKSDKHHPRIAWSEVQEFQMCTTNFNVFFIFATLNLCWSQLACALCLIVEVVMVCVIQKYFLVVAFG